MDIIRSTMKIGLKKPIRILHVTDTHICDFDDRDSVPTQQKIENFWYRRKVSAKQLVLNFHESVDYANKFCDLLVHTGDFIYIVSRRSLEIAKEELERSKNYIMITGNHEFSRFCGEAWEDQNYMMDNYHLVRSILGNDLLFKSRVVGGINFVGIDNSFYQVADWQTERLRREVDKGLPIVLFMHTPFFEESLYDKVMKVTNGRNACVMGCDEEHLLPFDEYRAIQERPDKPTKRFIEYVNLQPLIRCVLTGHVHFHHESSLAGGAIQYVTKAGFEAGAREVLFE